MTHYSFTRILLVFMMINFISCNNSTPTSPTQESFAFWPLKVGNKWYFQSYFVNDKNNIDSTVYSIINERAVSYQNHSILVNELKMGNYDNISFIKQENDGIYFYGDRTSSDMLIYKNLFLKYPCTKGESWKYMIYGFTIDNKIYLSDSVNVQCMNTHVNIKTLKDEYACYEYFFQIISKKSGFTEIRDYHWYIAPGIGPVCIRIQLKHKVDNDDTVYNDDLVELLIYSYEIL